MKVNDFILGRIERVVIVHPEAILAIQIGKIVASATIYIQQFRHSFLGGSIDTDTKLFAPVRRSQFLLDWQPDTTGDILLHFLWFIAH